MKILLVILSLMGGCAAYPKPLVPKEIQQAGPTMVVTNFTILIKENGVWERFYIQHVEEREGKVYCYSGEREFIFEK